MRKYIFIGLLLAIAFSGLVLRLVDYDQTPPFAETQDEFFYPWAGMTWIRTGIPVAWSWFPAYSSRNIVTYWGAQYPLVSPWLEKPPLYTLLMGTWVLLNGARELSDVRLSVIRLIPIGLSFLTIIFTGLIARKIFSGHTGIIAALLYAVVPTIILSNRLSLTENLLTPLVLAAVYMVLTDVKNRRFRYLHPVLAGLLAGLAVMTKNIGLAAVIAVTAIYILRGNWKIAIGVFGIGFLGVVIHPLIGFIYDWRLYQNVMADYQREFANSGLPQLIATLFLYPTAATKNHLLLDGTMLFGYLLFFVSPFLLFQREKPVTFSLAAFFKNNHEPVETEQLKLLTFLSFPVCYITMLSLIASGDKFSFYGWHVYPLFPFLMILVAHVFSKLWETPKFLSLLMLLLILGSSSIRFIFLLLPEPTHIWWQTFFILIIALSTLTIGTSLKRTRLLLSIFFLSFIISQIYTAINLSRLFPAFAQPL